MAGKFPTDRKEVIYILNLLAEVTVRGIHRFEGVEVSIQGEVPAM